MPSPLTVFGALNLNARNFDVELRRAVEKLENGMTGFLTQPVLSEQAVQNLQQARQTLGPEAKILAGILPVVSQRNAIFMETRSTASMWTPPSSTALPGWTVPPGKNWASRSRCRRQKRLCPMRMDFT